MADASEKRGGGRRGDEGRAVERAEGRVRARPGGGDAGVRAAGEERRRGGGRILSGRGRRERVDVADGRGEKEKEEEVPDGRATQVRAEGNSLRGNLQPIVDRGGGGGMPALPPHNLDPYHHQAGSASGWPDLPGESGSCQGTLHRGTTMARSPVVVIPRCQMDSGSPRPR